jgi:hypothetical protein
MESDAQNKANFTDVNLNSAKITGQLAMVGATFGNLDASSLEVGGHLFMRSEGENKASFMDVNLNSAKITGQLAMIGATFGNLNADSLRVGGDLLTPFPPRAFAVRLLLQIRRDD